MYYNLKANGLSSLPQRLWGNTESLKPMNITCSAYFLLKKGKTSNPKESLCPVGHGGVKIKGSKIKSPLHFSGSGTLLLWSYFSPFHITQRTTSNLMWFKLISVQISAFFLSLLPLLCPKSAQKVRRKRLKVAGSRDPPLRQVHRLRSLKQYLQPWHSLFWPVIFSSASSVTVLWEFLECHYS